MDRVLTACIPALSEALKVHEIGSGSPYEISFAAKGKSGGSFGFMQGDLAAGQAIVTQTFKKIMSSAGASNAVIRSLLQRLSVHVVQNPLTPEETRFVNNALDSHRADVDAMDQSIAQDVYDDLDGCITVASQNGRTISPKAMLYAGLWINMTGAPDRMKIWLSGGNPHLKRPVATAPTLVQGSDMRAYLLASDYYVKNPGNVPHLDESVRAGEQLLP